MDKELLRIAVTLERIAKALEKSNKERGPTRSMGGGGDGGIPFTVKRMGKPAKITTIHDLYPRNIGTGGAVDKGLQITVGKSNLQPCRKCGKPSKHYIGGRGLGECCRPKKKAKNPPKMHLAEKKIQISKTPKVEVRGVKAKRSAKAKASARVTERPEEQRAASDLAKPPPPTASLAAAGPRPASSRDLIQVFDSVCRFVHVLRDKYVGEKDIIWEIQRKAKEQGILVTEAQAEDIFANIKKSPRPGY